MLVLGFVGDKFGFAAGTGTHLLLTEDGDETWKNSTVMPELVFQAAFGDGQHGLIRTRSSLLSTLDALNGAKTAVISMARYMSESRPPVTTGYDPHNHFGQTIA